MVTSWVEAPTLSLDWSEAPVDRFGAMPAEVIERGRKLLDEMRSAAPRYIRYAADVARWRTGGRFQAEARALARTFHVDWRTLLAGSLVYDLALAFSRFGCSTIVLATPAGPVLARNMDWWPERALARASYLIRAEAGGRPVFANAGWPGAIAVVSGLSAHGFGVTLNAVRAPGGADLLGYPVLLHLRRVLEDAGSYDEAVAMLCGQRLAVGCLLAVVGCNNDQRVVIERTPREHAIRRPEGDEPIVVTNHYRALYAQLTGEGVDPGALLCTRYDSLAGFFADCDPPTEVTDAQLLYALTDRGVMQDITAQHVIIRPRQRSIRLLVPRRLLPAAVE